MRIDNRYAVWHTKPAVCTHCGHMFDKTPDWSLVDSRQRCYCSWSCLRNAEKAKAQAELEAMAIRAEKRKQNPRFLSDEERDRIFRMYEQGYSVTEIAKETARSNFSITNAIKARYGVYIAPERKKAAG